MKNSVCLNVRFSLTAILDLTIILHSNILCVCVCVCVPHLFVRKNVRDYNFFVTNKDLPPHFYNEMIRV